jgi:hypothetical protein
MAAAPHGLTQPHQAISASAALATGGHRGTPRRFQHHGRGEGLRDPALTGDVEDRRLAAAIAESGDEAAFRVLYRRHTPALYRLALRLGGGDEPWADDLVQRAWIRAVEGLAGFQWRSAFRTRPRGGWCSRTSRWTTTWNSAPTGARTATGSRRTARRHSASSRVSASAAARARDAFRGEQQMLAIARSLMSRPRLLLLDEPSLGLAPLLVREIFKRIREINQRGVTVLLVEQNAHMALSIARRGYVLETGHVRLEDEASRLLQNEEVKRAYLGG